MTGVRERDGRIQINFRWRGKRIWETLPEGTTKRQAGKLRTERLHAINRGTFTEPSAVTVAALLDLYARELVTTGRSAALQRIQHNACRWLVPAIGHIRLRDLTALDVAKARDAMLGSGKLGPKTTREYLGCLAVALEWAVKQGLLARNVARLVDKPKVQRHEVQPLAVEAARRLLAALAGSGTPYGRMLALGLLTGLRTESEWGGMRRCDVDLERRTASLVQVALNEKGPDGKHGVQLVPAGNTKHKRRQIELSDAALGIVRTQLEWGDGWAREVFGVNLRVPDTAGLRRYREWQVSGLLFSNHLLEPIPRATLTKYWKQYLAQAGLPDARIHDLRHTCATLLLQAGEHPKVVQEMLGHSTIGMTLNIYGHLVPGLAAAAGNRLAAVLTMAEAAQ